MSNLFVRKATGLVRSWSVMDAFIYAFFSINLVTLGLYGFSQMYYFEGGMINALVISAVFIFFEVIVYAGLIAVMPRSGGDYVWQSRILGGAVGFILAVTGWWFILWLWVPLYGDMFRHIVLVPLLGILGAKDAALWFAGTDHGAFVASLITLAIVSIIIALGMKTYARIQKFSFYGGVLGLLIVIALLLTGSNEAFRAGLDANATALFGAQAGVYDATVELGTGAGAITPLSGGSLMAVFLVLPYLVFFNLWPNWGATLYGEVRGATDFKRNITGMGSALVVTTLLGIVILFAISRTIGWDFYVQAGGCLVELCLGSGRCPASCFAGLAISRFVRGLPYLQQNRSIYRCGVDEPVVVRLERDRVPLLHARDLCRRLRPPATREGRRSGRTHRDTDKCPAFDGRSVNSGRLPVRV
ncbi:MAG: hypothetical protein M0C28_28380 [Candidatus Moduliflexus flocculans]|nr:hypothetical protein [Candidatus Moduliflexus flocculans]